MKPPRYACILKRSSIPTASAPSIGKSSFFQTILRCSSLTKLHKDGQGTKHIPLHVVQAAHKNSGTVKEHMHVKSINPSKRQSLLLSLCSLKKPINPRRQVSLFFRRLRFITHLFVSIVEKSPQKRAQESSVEQLRMLEQAPSSHRWPAEQHVIFLGRVNVSLLQLQSKDRHPHSS